MRIRFRYSVWTFLFALTVACAWLGKISIEAQQQRRAVAWVKRTGGGVLYDWNQHHQEYWTPPPAHPYPKWLRDLFGDDCFQTVTYVWLGRRSPVDGLTPLAALSAVHTLVASDCGIEDISPVARLPKLQALDVSRNRVSDLSPLTNLASLTELYAEDNQISDIVPLFDLNLETAELKGNPLSDRQLEKLNLQLEERSNARRRLKRQAFLSGGE